MGVIVKRMWTERVDGRVVLRALDSDDRVRTFDFGTGLWDGGAQLELEVS